MAMFKKIDEVIQQFDAIDWGDYERSCAQSQKFLLRLSKDKSAPTNLVKECKKNKHLRPKCEKYDLLTKLVLYENSIDARIRLHIFHDGYFDRPHNHRWPYTSNIIHGKYTHRLFLSDKAAMETVIDDLVLTKHEVKSVDEPYSLNNNIFHSITSHGLTVTLIARGPAKTKSFRVLDRVSGEAWDQHGVENESRAEIDEKRLSDAELSSAVKQLQSLEIIDG